MVHSLVLDGAGSVGAYRNRYVRTPLYSSPGRTRLALAYDPGTGRIDDRVTTANTHVVARAGRLLALEEGGFPYEITPDLATVGPFDFGGALATPMTAHPKLCPMTGELLFFGYQLRPPYVTVHVASPGGELLASVPVGVPAPTMMHDFAITATRVVLMDSPLVFDLAAAAQGGAPWRWDDGHGARLGVLSRAALDRGGGVRWFEIEPCHLSHVLNAHDDGDSGGGRIVLTGTRLPRATGPGRVGTGLPVLHRWTLDLASGRVGEDQVDDTPSEYPRLADHQIGLPHRFGYTTSFALDPEPDRSVIHKYDLAGATRCTSHHLPLGHTCGEPVFARRPSVTAEDDGWLLTFAHDRHARTSYLLILDAADVAAAPIAEVHLPVRVPAGIHGTWLPA